MGCMETHDITFYTNIFPYIIVYKSQTMKQKSPAGSLKAQNFLNAQGREIYTHPPVNIHLHCRNKYSGEKQHYQRK